MRWMVLITMCFLAVPAQAEDAAERIWTEGPLLKGVRDDTPITFGAFSKLAAMTSPAVVSIETRVERQGRSDKGAGSGFIVRADGYIVSNNHVVEDAVSIQVHLANGTSLRAKVVGSDPATDLSVIKVDNGDTPLPVVPLGDSEKLLIGEWVVAIGNPLNLSHTVTTGIVSAKGRRQVKPDMRLRYRDFIQTDAMINPGNSGGPLFNMRGEVVGVNTAIHAKGQGIGFAIPINMAKAVLPMLVQEGRVARSWLGVNVEEVTAEQARSSGMARPRGALVNHVDDRGPARAAGLVPGDIIVVFDGHEIDRHDDLPWLASTAGIGRKVNVGVFRDGAAAALTVTLGEQGKRAVADPEDERRLVLGMRLTEENHGIRVEAVKRGSVAARGGVRAGDLVVRHGNVPVRKPEELVTRLQAAEKAGQVQVKLLIQRGAGSTFVVFSRERPVRR